MTVVFIPFSTDLFAVHLKSGADEKVAALVYSGAFLVMGMSFGLLWTYITSHREALGVTLSDEEVRSTKRSFLIGNPIYAIAIAMSFVSAAAVLVIVALVAVYYAVVGMRSPAVE
jgi:uncharacterized membrane protein